MDGVSGPAELNSTLHPLPSAQLLVRGNIVDVGKYPQESGTCGGRAGSLQRDERGIAPKALENIFDEFQQGDGSATRRYGGSGLGLAISKKIVELLGGEISAESELGRGSVFSLSLPVVVRRESIGTSASASTGAV